MTFPGRDGVEYFDLTLAELAPFARTAAPSAWRALYDRIERFGPRLIEIAPEQAEALSGRDFKKMCLRVRTPDEARRLPGFGGYALALPSAPPGAPRGTRAVSLTGSGGGPSLRLTGPDQLMMGARLARALAFDRARPGGICLCPTDARSLAAGSAVNWLLSGGSRFAAAFGGAGNLAPAEEVLLALWTRGARFDAGALSALPEIRDLLEEITGARFPPDKPGFGRRIFHVESGVHVDGLLKDGRLYEPFPPELVGQARAIVIGKHSGRASIAAKLSEAGLDAAACDADALLRRVKAVSQSSGRALTDAEFFALAEKYRRTGREEAGA